MLMVFAQLVFDWVLSHSRELTGVDLLGDAAVGAVSANDHIHLDGVGLAHLAALSIAVEVHGVLALRAVLHPTSGLRILDVLYKRSRLLESQSQNKSKCWFRTCFSKYTSGTRHGECQCFVRVQQAPGVMH